MSHAPSPHSSRTPLLSACCALWKKYVAGNRAHCSLGGKIAIVLCLLPWGMFRRLTGRQAAMFGKRGMAGLLESAPESALLLSRMWRPLRWAILAPLVLAQRIYFRRGFVPGLLDACRNLRRAGPATAVRVLDPRTGAALSSDDWRPPLRLGEALAAWHLAAGGRGCLLLADLDAEGNGAVAYRERQVKRLTEEGWRVLLLRYTQDGRWSLTCRHIAGERPAELDCLDDMDEFFRVIPVARVFINNVAFHPDPLSVIAFFRDRKRRVGFALRYVFHDFLSLCPSLFLLNADNVHCGIPHLITCHHCLPRNPNRIVKETDIATWRAAWLTFFLACDELICFSESSRSIICRVYPIASRLRVEEHEPLAEFLEPFSPPVPGDCLHLAFVGYFVPLKGSRLAMQVLDLLGQRGIRARLHIFGRCPETDLPPNAVRHGPYEREELPKLLAEAGIAAVLFLSIWPETFSYTVQECMQTGVPLICLDLGAPAERLRGQAYPQARIAADASPEGLLAALDDLMRREYGRPLVSFAEKAGEENAHPTEPCPARGGTSVQPPLHETPKKESGHEN